MKSNNQILERYNPAKEDKKKVSKHVRPKGRIIEISKGFAVEVPVDATPEEIRGHISRAEEQLARSKTIEKNPMFKNYKGKDDGI